jgi:hypothetical protein
METAGYSKLGYHLPDYTTSHPKTPQYFHNAYFPALVSSTHFKAANDEEETKPRGSAATSVLAP